jgi:putative DNA primase/helicase
MQLMQLNYDGPIEIATGRSRKELNWKNKEMQYSELVKKLSVTHRTAETFAEYLSSKKPRQDEIKDIGGFVGGYLTKGRRKVGSVIHRQLITLDADFGHTTLWEDFLLCYGNAAVLYSTHKHSTDHPRYRIIIPLDRPVQADEYVAISRRVAGVISIDAFDQTTFQPERLMYWPSTSKDGVYEFQYQDGPWMSADEILGSYRDWRDSSEWPVSDRDHNIIQRSIKKQGDPLEKSGIVGAFCRTYSISEVLENFLADEYEACDVENRYTYKEGSTAAGLVVYDDKYAYSHHGTDPVSGKLCNAFDLVRLHKYGLKDEDIAEDTPINKKPSYIAMEAFSTQDVKVRKNLALEKFNAAQIDFAEITQEENYDDSWLAEMDIDRKSNYLSTRKNFQLVLSNDPKLRNCFAYDLFSKRKIVCRDLPWRKITDDTRLLNDEDECDLRIYLADKPYEISHNSNLKDVLDSIVVKQSVHPVLEYLQDLRWDGEGRLDTLFVDYMGANDSDYTRAVTRKSFVAAVGRIFEPGIKFDHILTLVGEEGKQKSSIFRKLGKKWFSDTFSFKMLERGKEAFEQLQGYWIIEIGELSGIKKADVESIKQFISKCEDVYRMSYQRYTSQFKRQCVFFGTTNKWDFLQGADGNRRFWPVPILVQPALKNLSKDLTDYEIDQVWAEAIMYFRKGETLYLPAKIEMEAKEMQRSHTEKDDRIGAVERFLDTLVPEDWHDRNIWKRRDFIAGNDLDAVGTHRRDVVCVAEIWCELIGGNFKDMNRANTKGLHEIMQHLPGWQRSNQKRFSLYGRQVTYVRVVTNDSKTPVFREKSSSVVTPGLSLQNETNDISNDGIDDV